MFKQSLKPYEKYKDSGVEWLGEIPADWKVFPTKRMFRLITDPAPKNNNIELLSVYTDIGVKPRKELEERGNKASTTDYYWLVKKGDIIVNKLLAWMGAIGISEYDGVTSPAYDVLRKTKELNSYYYHYLFRNPFTHQELKKYSKGIMDVRLRLYFSEFGRIILPLPPIEIQNRIVEYLNRKTGQAETFIEKQTRLIELLKEQKKAIINQAVTKGLNPDAPMKDSGIEWLGEIPAHWEVRKLKYFVKINEATLTEKTKSDFEFDYIDISSVSENGLFLKPERIKFKDAPSRARRIVRSGDTIISTVRTYLRAIEYFNDVKNHIVVSTGFAVLSPSQKIHKAYLSYLIRNEYFLNKVTANSIGIAYPAISTNIMGGFYLPIPKKEEQQQIVSYIETKTAKIDQAIEKAEKEITLVKEYLQSLIYNVVTGQLEIKKAM